MAQSRAFLLIALVAGVLAGFAPAALAAPASTVGPSTTMVSVADSCQGTLACQDSGTVGTDSCNGMQACQGSGNVGNMSCNAVQACQGATGSVGDYSCNGQLACQGAAGPIGNCMYNEVLPEACEFHEADGLIRRPGGQLKGDDVRNDDGTDQTSFDGSNRYRRGTCRTTYIYAQNDGNIADEVMFDAESEPASGVTVTFLTGGTQTDITSAVWDGTFSSPTLQPGEKFGIRGRICISLDAPHNAQIKVLVTVRPGDSQAQTIQPLAYDTVGFALRSR